MRRLRSIGINTVYVEAWKNGATQFPSTTLAREVRGKVLSLRQTDFKRAKAAICWRRWFG